MKRLIFLFLVVVILLALGAGAYYLQAPTVVVGVPKELVPDASSTSQSASSLQTVAAGMRRYTNTAYHFSVLVPEALQVEEYHEAGGAFTATFNDPSTDESFQMFIQPYAAAAITHARFAMDEPSGVREQPTDIVINNVRAVMFFSNNATMGDTREVWFLYNGYLYEITTYKELDQWLGTIMQSWQFMI